MNLEANPTVEQLRDLVRQCDDVAGDHVLWVKKNGDVAISLVSGGEDSATFEQSHGDVQLRFPTFQAGNEYVGAEAASDDDWIAEIFEKLLQKWNIAKGKAAVEYAENF